MRNQALLVIFFLLAGAAVWTLLPLEAPKANDLGYVSACPFAPWSTLALSLLAGGVWVLRLYFLTSPPAPRID